MDSPAACSRYIPRNSKKRVFAPGSSSSGCKEVEVLEISPPAIGRPSKPKTSKQKELAFGYLRTVYNTIKGRRPLHSR